MTWWQITLAALGWIGVCLLVGLCSREMGPDDRETPNPTPPPGKPERRRVRAVTTPAR